jgi:hypothetical protein
VSSRVLFAAGAGALLFATVAVVALSSGGDGDDDDAVALDPACLDAWNDDPGALSIGRHNFTFHEYETAQVTHLTVPEGGRLGGDETPCAVIFPAEALDPEPEAAAVAFLGGSWIALSNFPAFDEVRLAELQGRALADTNAVLDADGRLSELAEGG